MAKREIAWKGVGQDTTILREDASQDVSPSDTSPLKLGPSAAERVKHRLTVDIYEDQFSALEIRKAMKVAGTVTDQIREALDWYLEKVGSPNGLSKD